MAIITISRQLGSQGSDMTRMLSKQLKYRLFDKETLATELFQQGISDMKKYDEKSPGYTASYLRNQNVIIK